jgi:hypothetical protein
MKIEIQCMENKQPLAASCSSASEGSGCFFLKSPEIATPATVSSFPRYFYYLLHFIFYLCVYTTYYEID